MTRIFRIISFNGYHTAFEVVRLGQRAVSPRYNTKSEAEAAIAYLQANPDVSRVKLAADPA